MIRLALALAVLFAILWAGYQPPRPAVALGCDSVCAGYVQRGEMVPMPGIE